MPRKITLSKRNVAMLKTVTFSNENTGLLHEFIIDKNGIRAIDDGTYNQNHKNQIEISDENYLVRLEIEKNSNKETNLYIATFKDFILVDEMEEGKIGIIPLKGSSDNRNLRFSIEGHQIKMTIQKINSQNRQ